MSSCRKPWGSESLLHAGKFAVKRIRMTSGKRCSLQHHKKKCEYIYIVRGKMLLTLGEHERTLGEGDGAYIPAGEIHRMEALHELVYVEASTPELDDVVRHDDDYGRV